MPGVCLCCSARQAHRGATLAGTLLCSSVHQVFDGPSSLLFSCRCWLVWDREATVMVPPPKHDSAVSPCFHGCPALLHRPFPSQSPPSPPLYPSLCSQQQPLPWDQSTIPTLCVPLRGMYGYNKDCLILIPFRLPQISCFTLSLKCFSSDSDNCPYLGIRLLLQVPTC